MERLWTRVYEYAAGDEWSLYIIGTSTLSFGVFVVLNLIFGSLDIFGVPAPLRRFKIQKHKNVPMDTRRYADAVFVSTFNMTVIVVATLLVIWHTVAKDRMLFRPSELPTLWKATTDFIFCAIFDDIGFYYLHRLLHTSSFLYKNIHKIHHSWTAPCSVATFYCHPIEQALVNVAPFVLGPALVGAHLSTAWVFWVLGITSTMLAHSGYHFPLLPSSQAHDFHHQKYVDQYSVFGVLDWLHKTNTNFKKSVNAQRHFYFCSWTPVDELVKDRK